MTDEPRGWIDRITSIVAGIVGGEANRLSPPTGGSGRPHEAQQPYSGQQAPPQPGDYGSSLWAVIAGIVLLVLGLLVALFGVVLVAQGLAFDEPGKPGFGTFVAVIGVAVLAIGILHLKVAISIWAHRAWARSVGIVGGVLGALLGAKILPSAFDPRYVRGNGDELILAPPDISYILSGLILFPYLVVVIGLLVGGGHFRRGPG